MSSFLCFVCHSTVNADTNEETRDKYREVIGMHLCPDSHLCYICCYFLNKMCMFKSICLKRSLEYPVLFSEKGTINLQRSDIQVAILCTEDLCLQHLNTRIHFYNNSENSQSDFDDNSYCQLQDDNIKSTDFHCQLQGGNLKITDFHCQLENGNLKSTDFHCQLQNRNTGSNDFHCQYKDGILKSTDFYGPTQENMKNLNYNCQTQDINEKGVDFQCQFNDGNFKGSDFHCQYKDSHLKGLDFQIQPKDENMKFNAHNDNMCAENYKDDLNLEYKTKETNSSYIIHPFANSNKELNQINQKEIKATDDNTIQTINKPIEPILLDLNKTEVILNAPFEKSTNTSENDETNSIYTMDSDSNSEIPTEDIEKERRKKREFTRIKLTVKEQKKELEEARREEKYVTAVHKCYNCAISFHLKDSYQAHMMRHEESNGEHSCVICSLRFANPAVLRSHIRNHTERYQCTQCKAVVRARQRMTHKRMCSESQNESNTVYCHLCNAGFIGSSHLQQHIKRYHKAKNSNRTYLCNICGKRYDNQAAVRTHMITHINRKFSCDQCSATFSSPYTLNQHKKKHNSTDNELHYCTACKIGYTTRKSLLAHLRNALAHKDSVYKCPLCPRICPTVGALQSHTDAVHARTNHLTCDICPAKYSTRKALIRHLRSHKGETRKPVTLCHICGDNFKTSSILKRHLKNVCEKDKLEELFFEQ